MFDLMMILRAVVVPRIASSVRNCKMSDKEEKQVSKCLLSVLSHVSRETARQRPESIFGRLRLEVLLGIN